ncbi:hypothetical protein PR048_024273 [Dryococelus australis]|uniref:Uncharacterized protein n=1 Tax=Dryococelus australis TaxID=614101 RepID=A0ABQ9GN44_9NEOP|nr:hypothetical protein PR048_024273 [Dryococelus australis]
MPTLAGTMAHLAQSVLTEQPMGTLSALASTDRVVTVIAPSGWESKASLAHVSKVLADGLNEVCVVSEIDRGANGGGLTSVANAQGPEIRTALALDLLSGAAANEHTAEARVYTGLWSLAYRSSIPIPSCKVKIGTSAVGNTTQHLASLVGRRNVVFVHSLVSPHSTLIVSQDLVVKSPPNLSTQPMPISSTYQIIKLYIAQLWTPPRREGSPGLARGHYSSKREGRRLRGRDSVKHFLARRWPVFNQARQERTKGLPTRVRREEGWKGASIIPLANAVSQSDRVRGGGKRRRNGRSIVTWSQTHACARGDMVSMEQRRNARAWETGEPEKTHRPASSSDTIPTCENTGATPLGIEPSSRRWEASSLTTTPPRPHNDGTRECTSLTLDTFICADYVGRDWEAPSSPLRGRGGVVVRLLASYQGEPGSIPAELLPDFDMLYFCRTMPVVGGFSWGSPISPAFAFWRCCILTSLHPHRLSRPRHRGGFATLGLDSSQSLLQIVILLVNCLRNPFTCMLLAASPGVVVVTHHENRYRRSVLRGTSNKRSGGKRLSETVAGGGGGGERAAATNYESARASAVECKSLALRGDGALVACDNVALIAIVLQVGRNLEEINRLTKIMWWNSVEKLLTNVAEANFVPSDPVFLFATLKGRRQFTIFVCGILYTSFHVGAVVAERLACSPPTKVNRAQSPAGSLPDFRKWESCRTMPLITWFSWGSSVSPALAALPHSHLILPSSALNTSLLRSLTISLFNVTVLQNAEQMKH